MAEPIPLFPDEKTIALAVLGVARAKQWPAIAKYLEDKQGLPRVDTLMGGRYWPAIVQFFELRHRVPLAAAAPDTPRVSPGVRVMPFAPDGKENYDEPPPRRRLLDATADATPIRERLARLAEANDAKLKAARMTKRERDVLAAVDAANGQFINTDGHRRRAVRWLELHCFLEVRFDQAQQFARITPVGEAEWRRILAGDAS